MVGELVTLLRELDAFRDSFRVADADRTARDASGLDVVKRLSEQYGLLEAPTVDGTPSRTPSVGPH